MSYNIETEFILKGLLDTYDPPTVESIHWEKWLTHIGPTTCLLCLN